MCRNSGAADLYPPACAPQGKADLTGLSAPGGTAAFGDHFEADSDPLDIKRVGVVAVGPIGHLVMLLVVGIPDRLEEVGETTHPTDILRRTGVLPVDIAGVLAISVERTDAFDLDVVDPVITEVVDILEPLDAPFDQGFQLEPALLENGMPQILEIGTRRPVDAVADMELVQMAIEPPHRSLDDIVQPFEADIVGDGDTSPDGWLALLEDDLDRHIRRQFRRHRFHMQMLEMKGSVMLMDPIRNSNV